MTNHRHRTGTSTCHRPCSLHRAGQAKIHSLLSNGFPYSRKLSVHNSCVNALTFSNGDGRWLASAGDDPYILLWDFHQDNVLAPSHVFRGPRANVFTLAFSATNQYLYSGDTNEAILKYDLTRLTTSSTDPGLPVSTIYHHTESVRAISCHPELDDVFISAGEDGKIALHDARAEHRMSHAQATLQHTASFTCAVFHPTIPHIFATTDQSGRVCLRDTRMAFGPLHCRSQNGIVQTYMSALSKRSLPHLCRPEATSVAFNRTGTKLCVTFLNYFPTIYSLDDPAPLAICSGLNRPDGASVPEGESTYSNACTMKHGSFGGLGLLGNCGGGDEEYYSAGSDDFCAYVWKIPGVEQLKAAREAVGSEQWWSEKSDKISFTSYPGNDLYTPVELSTPLCRVTGHRSIVNTTLMHPHMPLLFTAGVERHILLHSPTPSCPCAEDLPRTPTQVRELPGPNVDDRRRMIRALTSGLDREEDQDDDDNTIALFDEILRSESNVDVFQARRWDPDPDSDEEIAIGDESEMGMDMEGG